MYGITACIARVQSIVIGEARGGSSADMNKHEPRCCLAGGSFAKLYRGLPLVITMFHVLQSVMLIYNARDTFLVMTLTYL